MECNKDEAIRAKDIAEKKMENNDFEGAQKMAKRAQTHNVNLFQRTSQSKSFFVRPRELYRFSHRVPCFKMTGRETAGVSEGSFELDPASLPLNPDNLYYLGKSTMEKKDLNNGVNGLSAESAKQRGKTMISEGKSTAKDSVEGTGKVNIGKSGN